MDVNADSWLDICVVSHEKYLYCVENEKGNGFSGKLERARKLGQMDANGIVFATDLNFDKREDFVTYSNEKLVWWENSPPLETVQTSVSPNSDDGSMFSERLLSQQESKSTLFASMTPRVVESPPGFTPWRFQFADLTGNGLQDIVVLGENLRGAPHILVQYGKCFCRCGSCKISR